MAMFSSHSLVSHELGILGRELPLELSPLCPWWESTGSGVGAWDNIQQGLGLWVVGEIRVR